MSNKIRFICDGTRNEGRVRVYVPTNENLYKTDAVRILYERLFQKGISATIQAHDYGNGWVPVVYASKKV